MSISQKIQEFLYIIQDACHGKYSNPSKTHDPHFLIQISHLISHRPINITGLLAASIIKGNHIKIWLFNIYQSAQHHTIQTFIQLSY